MWTTAHTCSSPEASVAPGSQPRAARPRLSCWSSAAASPAARHGDPLRRPSRKKERKQHHHCLIHGRGGRLRGAAAARRAPAPAAGLWQHSCDALVSIPPPRELLWTVAASRRTPPPERASESSAALLLSRPRPPALPCRAGHLPHRAGSGCVSLSPVLCVKSPLSPLPAQAIAWRVLASPLSLFFAPERSLLETPALPD